MLVNFPDEETAMRALWAADFGNALLECMDDAKRGVDSSDLVRKAAYRALAPTPPKGDSNAS